MLQLFVYAVLMRLPAVLLCGLLCFVAARWSLQRKNRTVRLAVGAGLRLCLTILAVGIVYGILRFSGVIILAGDNGISYNWFDASCRDDGFNYICACGTVFAGFLAALLLNGKQAKHEELTS